jgi:hypothetical protein
MLRLAAALAMMMAGTPVLAHAACNLDPAHGQIKHVIFVQFDNVHFRRDNPNVPSDLEQMPNLLNFLNNNGTLITNHHAILISHTAGDIVTTLTGVYPDRNGIAVSNSYRAFPPSGSSVSVSAFFLLDRPGKGYQLSVSRRDLRDADRWAKEHAGTMGTVHPRGLRCRQFFHC